jgi:Tfp pilus assembly protein PilP
MEECEHKEEKESIRVRKIRARRIPKGKRYREVKKRAKKQTAHKLVVEIQHAHTNNTHYKPSTRRRRFSLFLFPLEPFHPER